MRMCRLMLSVVAFGLTCLQSIADVGDPTDLGCVIPLERQCDFNPLTGECGETCTQWAGNCGYWAAYESHTYIWAKIPVLPEDNGVVTFDNTAYDVHMNCGELYRCKCDLDNQLNFVCTIRSFFGGETIWQEQIHFDSNEECQPR